MNVDYEGTVKKRDSTQKRFEMNQVSAPSFSYWSKAIRQYSLVKDGIMAVMGQPCFVEITIDGDRQQLLIRSGI